MLLPRVELPLLVLVLLSVLRELLALLLSVLRETVPALRLLLFLVSVLVPREVVPALRLLLLWVARLLLRLVEPVLRLSFTVLPVLRVVLVEVAALRVLVSVEGLAERLVLVLVPRVLDSVVEPLLRLVLVFVPRVLDSVVVPLLRLVLAVPRDGVLLSVARLGVPVDAPRLLSVPRVAVPEVLLLWPEVVLVLALRPVELAAGACVVVRVPVVRLMVVMVFSPRVLVMRLPSRLVGLFLTGVSERAVVMLPTRGRPV